MRAPAISTRARTCARRDSRRPINTNSATIGASNSAQAEPTLPVAPTTAAVVNAGWMPRQRAASSSVSTTIATVRL